MLSADKALLVGGAYRENRQVFEVPPILEDFARLLRIIQEEIVTYRIWPVCPSTSTKRACVSHFLLTGELLVLLFSDPATS